MRLYPKREALVLTGATEAQLSRWAQDGIIVPTAGGGARGADRRYSLRNLVEIAICRRLHRLGVSGLVMRWLISGGPEGEDGALWIAVGKQWESGRPVSKRPVLGLKHDAYDLDEAPDATPTVVITDDEFAAFDDTFGIVVGLGEILRTLATRLGTTYDDVHEIVFGDPTLRPVPPLVSPEAVAAAYAILTTPPLRRRTKAPAPPKKPEPVKK